MRSSGLKKFYLKTPKQRLESVKKQVKLSEQDCLNLSLKGKMLQKMDLLAENVIGVFPLPFSILTNFIINGKEILIPFACLEAGVVAGACFAAKSCRPTGGFIASSNKQIITGHIIIAKAYKNAISKILKNKERLLTRASYSALKVKKGVKPLGISCKQFNTKQGRLIGVYVDFDVGNITGPRTISKICQSLTRELESITGGVVRMALHSDFSIKRLARAKAIWHVNELDFSEKFSGKEVIEGILDLFEYANNDIYRACTNNKGIMNGITALAIATGNDAPLLEAGVHSFTAKSGKYLPLAKFSKNKKGDLVGEIELPIAMGTEGGVTKHPLARTSCKIMGVKSARELAEVAACVGLAQNFAALRAMVTQSMVSGNEKIEGTKHEVKRE